MLHQCYINATTKNPKKSQKIPKKSQKIPKNPSEYKSIKYKYITLSKNTIQNS